MSKKLEMVGERFGYLIVLRWSADHKMFECACVGGGLYCRRVSLNSENDLPNWRRD